MSSNAFEATIDLAPGPSVRAVGWLFALHAVPLVLLVLALKPGVLMAALGLAMGASWTWLRRHRAFGYGPRALVRLTWHAAGSRAEHAWTVRDAAGASFDADLLGNSVVHAALLVLNFRLADGARRSRILVGDELPPEQFRRLRARLAISPQKD